MNLQPVHPNFVCQVWPAVKDLLSEALAHSGQEYSVDQLQGMLVRGDQTLLVLEDDGLHGAATIVFENFPNARVAFVTAMGGFQVITEEIYGLLADWCRANGCTRIQAATREATARLFSRVGFKQRYIIVEQEL